VFADAFAAIASGFSAVAGGPYTDGLLKWAGTPTLDAGGSITSPGTPVEIECKVQVDRATEAMRADAGFQQRDVRLLILASGLTAIPDEAAHVDIAAGENAGIYALQTVERDPAGIGYECRARLVPGAVS
jgi:hypothetical protein